MKKCHMKREKVSSPKERKLFPTSQDIYFPPSSGHHLQQMANPKMISLNEERRRRVQMVSNWRETFDLSEVEEFGEDVANFQLLGSVSSIGSRD